MKDLSDFRVSYEKYNLSEESIVDDPLILFKEWFEQICDSKQIKEPNAMTLSTVDSNNTPNNRVVLLKKFSNEGFIFYTNYMSNKGKSMSNNSNVCLSFFWPSHERQVIIKGNAYKTSEDLSDQYFNSRPKGSKLGALVSKNQSSVIESKKVLIQRFNQLSNEFKSKSIERPKNWGGYIIKPIEYEFWQGGPDRLHDRIRYRNNVKNWIIERLSP